MRVAVTGTCDSVHTLMGLLNDNRVGYTVESNPKQAHYEIILESSRSGIFIDAADSELERQTINCISELTTVPITLLRPGGIQQNNRLRLGIPDNAITACETGIFRAVLKVCGHGKPKPTFRARFGAWIAGK
jgi:hypothetical protein